MGKRCAVPQQLILQLHNVGTRHNCNATIPVPHPPVLLCPICSVKVTAGAFYYIVVSGSAPADAGAFTLTLANSALAT